MFTSIAWKSFYSVGDPLLDADHQRIFRTINELYGAMQQGTDPKLVPLVLEQLLDYALTHFKREERVMQDCGYPDFAQHKAIHDVFRTKAADLADHADLVASHDLLHFLKSWWLDHIQGQDKRYAPYLCMPASR